MKRKLLVVAAALLAASAVVYAQPMGPGMMGGYGSGYGMGPGMMSGGGYGPGYGQGYGSGYGGMGPGMMGGYGPGSMGPGMMGGYGAGGMGPGMMGGYGGYGYGPDLSAEQRDKMAEIQQEFAQKHWDLMGKMHAQGGPMSGAFGRGDIDEKSARKSYDAMAEAQKQMFELSLQTRKRIDAVLTPEQREQMRGGGRGRGPR